MDLLFAEQWKNNHHILHAPDWVQAWLRDTGSMTERVKQVCRENFNVRVLRHEFVAATYAIADLHLAAHESVLQREVLLCDADTPLIFAYSLLPESALCGHYLELRELGSRPLGHWLFSEPVLKRHAIQIIELNSTSPLFNHICSMVDLPTTIWGRKALFTGAEKPFLVSEFFLPALLERTQ